MSEFKSFLKGNVQEIEDVSLKLKRFDEPIVIRALGSDESDAINERCFENKPGRKGKQERVFNVAKYNRDICTAAIVYPNLNDTALQESYGVRGADNLYGQMFILGEANEILSAVMEVSGIDSSLDDEIDKAKN